MSDYARAAVEGFMEAIHLAVFFVLLAASIGAAFFIGYRIGTAPHRSRRAPHLRRGNGAGEGGGAMKWAAVLLGLACTAGFAVAAASGHMCIAIALLMIACGCTLFKERR